MNFSETIKEIVRLNSINVLQNDSLFLAMFSDLAPDLKKERKIIKRICEESMMHAFFILVTCKDGDRETVINAIVQELKNEIGLTEEWIQEIIDAFDLAFDLKVSSTILRNKIDNTDDMTPLSKLFKQNFGDANHCDGQIQSIDQILSLSAVNEEYDPEDFGKFINPRHIKADGVLIPCGVGNADNGFILHGISPVSKSKHECAPLLGLIYNFLIRNSKMSEDDIPHVLENDDDLYGSDHKMIYRYTIVIISAIRSGYTNFNELLIRPLDYTKECRMALKVINEYIRIFFTIAGKKPITYRLATKATTTVSMKSKNAKIYVVDNTQYTVARTLYFAPKINYKLDERHKDALEDLLREISPFTSFKDGQYEAICKMINSTKHAVCIMPTGSGKSLVYYFMSILQPLPIFVISPTDILIRDQIRNLRKFHKIDNIAHLKMVEGVDFERLELCNSLIYLNPATFQNRGLLVRFRHLNADQLVGAVVLDEIHCLSNWGHDFRPEYLMLSKNLNRILDRTVFMGFTATANYTVVEDIQKQLGIPQENFFSPVSFDKYNASYHYSDYQTTSEMLSAVSELATKIVADNERAIVFTKNDKISRLVADAIGYEADVFLADNPKAYYQFADGTCKILVTSEDLGIGINFSNVTNVIHFGLPVSKNEYVQEIGRAGRGDEYIHSYVLFLTPSPDNVDPLLLKRESDINKTAQILNLMDNDYSDIYHKMNMNADTSDVLMERLLEVHDDLVYKYRALAAVYDEKQVDEIKKYLYMLYVTGFIKDWYTWRVWEEKKQVAIMVERGASLETMRSRSTDYYVFMGNDRKSISRVSKATSLNEIIRIYAEWYYEKYLYHHKEEFLDMYHFIIDNQNGNFIKISEEISKYFTLPFAKIKRSENYYQSLPLDIIAGKAAAGLNAEMISDIERINSNRYSYKLDFLLFLSYWQNKGQFDESRIERFWSKMSNEEHLIAKQSILAAYKNCNDRAKWHMLCYMEKPNEVMSIKMALSYIYQDGYKDYIYYALVAKMFNEKI